MFRTLHLKTMFILIIFSYALQAQSTRLFWVDEDSYNGELQSANADGSGLVTLVDNLNMPCGLAVDDKSDPEKIYFCVRGEAKIMRCNLDGTNPEDVITDVPGIRDFELDLDNRKIYWIRDTWDDDAVQRADMDGVNLNIEDIFTSTSTSYGFYGIGLDLDNQALYWTQANNGCQDKIRKINFDGTGFTEIVKHPQNSLINPWDIDVAGGKIYWTDCGLSMDVIFSANLDGSNIDTVITEVDCQFFTIDESVSKLYWGDNGTIYQSNLDGTDRQELITGLGYFLMGIEVAHDVPATALENEKTQPKTLSLLTNYPNPFNPVTTIRYTVGDVGVYGNTSQQSETHHHASLHDINLTIYNMSGQKIETLFSGSQPSGQYEIRWNASDLAGGVYFYQLTISNRDGEQFTRSKKMVLLK